MVTCHLDWLQGYIYVSFNQCCLSLFLFCTSRRGRCHCFVLHKHLREVSLFCSAQALDGGVIVLFCTSTWGRCHCFVLHKHLREMSFCTAQALEGGVIVLLCTSTWGRCHCFALHKCLRKAKMSSVFLPVCSLIMSFDIPLVWPALLFFCLVLFSFCLDLFLC